MLSRLDCASKEPTLVLGELRSAFPLPIAPLNPIRLKGNMPPLSRLITRGIVSTTALGSCLSSTAATAFDPVAATEAYLAKLSPEARARSDAYFEGGYWLLLVSLLVTLFICWFLLRSGIATRLRTAVEGRFKRLFVRGYIYVLIISAIIWVLGLPLEIYSGFWREHFYELSNQNFVGWLTEQLIGLAVMLVLLPPIVACAYAGIRRSPKNWWVVASVVTPFLILFFAVISPVFIAPLFNKFQPLEDPAVRDPILAMARANGVPADNVYEFNASKQSKRVSANVSGAFGTIRISLNDNLLARCPPEGVMAAMGHELGHYVLDHVIQRVIYQSIVFVAVFWFVHRFFGFVVNRRGAAWGVTHSADLAGLPIMLAGLSLGLFLTTPARNSIIRVAEVQADYYGLNAARQPDAMADVFVMLSEYRKLKPGPVEEILFFTHPSGYNRVLAAMRWKAEHLPSIAPAVPPENLPAR